MLLSLQLVRSIFVGSCINKNAILVQRKNLRFSSTVFGLRNFLEYKVEINFFGFFITASQCFEKRLVIMILSFSVFNVIL